ncbi:glycine receptor subunit alpha-2-like [Tachypleus tridentatus]|uniref:glycine receptor subunit alpha-2-like n=1 Tax=Tachypleus tridentatus TaxID=6853 RepID=UPI003FD0BB06
MFQRVSSPGPMIFHSKNISLTCIFSALCRIISCMNNNVKNAIEIHNIVPSFYDRMRPPIKDGNPVEVHIRIAVLNILSVDEEMQVYEADIFYHQFWKDHRLNSTATSNYPDHKVILDNRWRNDLWTPDTYFKNSIKGNVHTIINPYSYMVLYNNSKIFFAARMSLTLGCEMNLGSYPHDVQECGIEVMSLQYTNDSVVLLWKEFQITGKLLHQQFDFTGHTFTNCTKKYSIGKKDM